MTAFPLAFLLGGAALVATSLIGWSVDVEASAFDRVSGDKWLLAISALAGGATGALPAWALTSRTFVVLGGALLGVVPALVKTSAYFTNAYCSGAQRGSGRSGMPLAAKSGVADVGRES